MDRISTQTLVPLIPHTVISSETQTFPHTRKFKDLQIENTGIYSQKKKILLISGPAQFKHVLFKDQLYLNECKFMMTQLRMIKKSE